ncbi:MAG: hypothetical protein MUF23_13780 [Pirellula sp.]|jgi:hypothetical protein|nr:hypothetical protein [Pirellula sp.]
MNDLLDRRKECSTIGESTDLSNRICIQQATRKTNAVDPTLKNNLHSLKDFLYEQPFAAPLVGPGTGIASPAAAPAISLVSVLERWERERPEKGKSLSDELQVALSQAQALVAAPACPIVAVLGMLNAGKSSLVATFLGPSLHGPSRRVLIGSANNEGTHRFVLWLPASWRTQSGVWEFVTRQLQSVFGTECEMLSEDPSEASRQYNDLAPRTLDDGTGKKILRQPIEIPLIATDPNLDRLGIALMDCPDVQTGLITQRAANSMTRYEEATARAAETRFEVLSRAATLCSAFLVVLPANALHDQTVSRLLKLLEQRMPHVQRMIAVNRVPRRYATSEIAREVEQLYRASHIRRVYMAYNFDGPQLRERLPTPPGDLEGFSTEAPLPLFFRIDGTPAPQPPEAILDAQWLIRLGSQLHANDLLADAIRSATSHLTTIVHRALSEATQYLEQKRQQLCYLQQVVADACTDFSLDPSSPSSNPRLRLQASRQIIQQVAESLERTAPWWAKPGRWVQRIAQAGKSTVAGAASWLKVGWLSDGSSAVGEWVRARFKRGESGRVVTADTLCEYLVRRDRLGLLRMDESPEDKRQVRDACQRAIERFQAESAARLDPGHIDDLTSRIWAEMPMRQRILSGVAPAGVLFAPLLAVIMIPLDFGGTSVLVFASLKELLFAGAAGVGLVLASSDSVPALAESESAWQQLSDLVAVVTDELGLDRSQPPSTLEIQLANVARPLTPSPIPMKRYAGPDAPGATWSPMETEAACIDSIHQTLDAMERAQRT